jgi:hypothetical protein
MAKSEKLKPKSLPAEHWKNEPDDHDYPAAGDYLSLLMEESDVQAAGNALRAATITHRKAKDLLRASQLALLPPENPHVALDLDKVRRGEHLSPILLVRGSAEHDIPLTVADGYHRICASYHIDENADIPCRIASMSEISGAKTSADPSAQGLAG